MSAPLASTSNCFGCRHFLITHEREWPYACQRFELRSKRLPSAEVELASGAPCAAREPRGAAGEQPTPARS